MCLTQKGQIAMDIDRGRLERKYLNLWPGSRKVQNSLQSGKRGFCPYQGKTEQAQSFLLGQKQQVVIYSKRVDTCSLGFILNSSQNISSQHSQWQIFFMSLYDFYILPNSSPREVQRGLMPTGQFCSVFPDCYKACLSAIQKVYLSEFTTSFPH